MAYKIPKESKTHLLFACKTQDIEALFDQCDLIYQHNKDKAMGFGLMDYSHYDASLKGLDFVIYYMKNTKNIEANKQLFNDLMQPLNAVLIKDDEREFKKITELTKQLT